MIEVIEVVEVMAVIAVIGGIKLIQVIRAINERKVIKVIEVIESIEGPFSITNCISETGYCVQFEKCTIKSPIHLLNDAVHLILKQLTLAQMIVQGMMQPKYNSDNSSKNLVTFSSLPIA